MLLLVVEADLDQRREADEDILVRGLEEFHDRRIDMTAIGGDLFRARAGQKAARVAGMPGAGADVIGIEQEGVVAMIRLVACAVFAEQELLEEPGGMGSVPFRRARIRHRLHDLVFRGKRGGAALGLATDGEECLHQVLGEAAGIGEK